LNPTVDNWVMPNVRGLAGVLGSGLSMIAAGIAALVLVSVLLAFHGWPTNAATGTVPRLIAATTSTQAPVPTLVIGRTATGRTAVARRGGALVRQAPAPRTHNAPSSVPLYSDASKPKTPGLPPKPTPKSCGCLEVPTPLPAQITQLIDQSTKSANSLTQQLNDGVTSTTQTAGGVVNGVTRTVAKTLSGK
jgi:hypothetical protein